jgi:hypothetical protein
VNKENKEIFIIDREKKAFGQLSPDPVFLLPGSNFLPLSARFLSFSVPVFDIDIDT